MIIYYRLKCNFDRKIFTTVFIILPRIKATDFNGMTKDVFFFFFLEDVHSIMDSGRKGEMVEVAVPCLINANGRCGMTDVIFFAHSEDRPRDLEMGSLDISE